MRWGGVDTNGLPLREARHAHRGRERTADLSMHSDMHDAPHVKILTNHRGNGEMAHLIMRSDMHDAPHVKILTDHRGNGENQIMDLDRTDARLAKIPMSDLPTDGLTLGPVARHVGAVVGLGENKVGLANHRRKDGLPSLLHCHCLVD